jgi:hypothetical protein
VKALRIVATQTFSRKAFFLQEMARLYRAFGNFDDTGGLETCAPTARKFSSAKPVLAQANYPEGSDADLRSSHVRICPKRFGHF